MKIIRKKASDYNKITARGIAAYCKEYITEITTLLALIVDKPESVSRTPLKITAAELETIKKRLRYYILGEY